MTRRRKTWLGALGVVILLVVLLVIFWDWDWFIPLVQAQASAALGRKVTLTHLRVGIGGSTTVTATGITIANPKNFPIRPGGPPNFGTIDKLVVKVDLGKYVFHRTLSLTTIEVDHPVFAVRQYSDGTDNYTLHPAGNPSQPAKPSNAKPPELGELIINNGAASVVMPKLKTNFDLAIQTRATPFSIG